MPICYSIEIQYTLYLHNNSSAEQTKKKTQRIFLISSSSVSVQEKKNIEKQTKQQMVIAHENIVFHFKYLIC